MTRHVRRLPALAVVLVASVALAGCELGPRDTSWARVERGELVIGVEVTGQLASSESHPLGPPPLEETWNFKIAMMAPEGSAVEAGAPVLAFDTSELRQDLERYQNEADSADKQLQAETASARMRARDGELRVAEAVAAERKAGLMAQIPEGLAASIAVRKAELDYQLARAVTETEKHKLEVQKRTDGAELARLRRVRERARERVAETQQAITAMQVSAPIGGTVLHVTNWRGEKKKTGESVWRGQRVVEVVSLAHLRGEGMVDETDASRIAVGQRVGFRLNASADVPLTGEVAQIEESIQQRAPEDPLKVVRLDIAIDAQDKVELRPGMQFRGTVETARIADVLLVPLAAVLATPDGPIVYRKTSGEPETVSVTLGRRNQDLVEVTAGLSEGDEVALVGAGETREEEP